jgi:hypothetical protein
MAAAMSSVMVKPMEYFSHRPGRVSHPILPAQGHFSYVNDQAGSYSP